MKNLPRLWWMSSEEPEPAERWEEWKEILRASTAEKPGRLAQEPEPRAQWEARSRVRAAAKRLAQDALYGADWEAAEIVLKEQSRVLLQKFPILQPQDIEFLMERVRNKLLGMRKIQSFHAGYPAGLLAVLLMTAATELMDQREKSKILARISLLNSNDRALFAMRILRKMTIGQIALELKEPYATVAVRIFHMMRQVRGD
jgi:hypothetical protein